MDDLVKWCEEERQKMLGQINGLQSGGKLQANNGMGWVDVTAYWIKEYQRRITDLDNLLARIAERAKNSN